MTDYNFKVNPELTGISLAYINTDYIADKILPRVPVSQKSFEYKEYPVGTFLSNPKTEVGRKGRPETVEGESMTKTVSVKSHSVLAEVPEEDILEAKAAQGDEDPMADNTTIATECLSLAREVRTAQLLNNPETYGSKNVITLSSGSDQLNDKSSSFIDMFKQVKKKMIVPPTHMVVSDDYALSLQAHPDFLSIFKSDNSSNHGLVPLDYIARMLGLKEILVSKSKVNNAKPGVEPNIVNVWGNNLIFAYINPLAKPKYGMTFGFTAEKGKREVQEYFDGIPGSKGIHYIKPVEEMIELVTAKSCGCLVKNAFAV